MINFPDLLARVKEAWSSARRLPRIDLVPVVKFQALRRPQRYCFILDPGHGPATSDRQSPPLLDGRTYFEYAGNRRVVAALSKELTKRGIDYTVTNDPELPGNSLKERVRRANDYPSRRPKLFLSFHTNAGPVPNSRRDWSAAHGVETFYFPDSGAGLELAAIVQRHQATATQLRDRGAKPSEHYYVLRKTVMPAVIVEGPFHNNPEEVRLLLDDEFIERLAQAYADALDEVDRFGLQYYYAPQTGL